MRILLINPRSKAIDALPIPPLGILYLAAYVRGKGYKDIKVIDDNKERMPYGELYEHIKEADILGLTGTTSQFHSARFLALLARQLGVLTVYGGSHASALPEESLKAGMDIVVCGEGEQVFHQILMATENAIEGKYRGLVINGLPVDNIDSIPSPARDLIPIQDYPTRELKRFKGAYTHMMTGRGCSGKCIFCSSPSMWGAPRLMSAERIYAEMTEIYTEYGIKNIHFQDDSFTLSRKRVIELCNLIRDGRIGFKWSCQTRPDMVDRELLRFMSYCGCVQIEFGVESGDSEILKTACKGYTKQNIKEAVQLAKRASISTYGFFILGLPGETIWTWLKSIWFAITLGLDSSVWTVLLPYPGTEVYQKQMVKILDPDYANWLYKRPIIKVGRLTPTILRAMRNIADTIVNGLFNRGVYKAARLSNDN